MTLLERLNNLNDEKLEQYVRIITENKNKDQRWNKLISSGLKQLLEAEYEIRKYDLVLSGGIEQITREFFQYQTFSGDLVEFRNHLKEKIGEQKRSASVSSHSYSNSSTAGGAGEKIDPIEIAASVIAFVFLTPILYIVLLIILTISYPSNSISDTNPDYVACMANYRDSYGYMTRDRQREVRSECRAFASRERASDHALPAAILLVILSIVVTKRKKLW